MLRFGTDGVRGVAGSELTPELALLLGRAAARVLVVPTDAGRPLFVVGRDTRLSGPMIQAAFSAGLSAEGVDVIDLGVLPTPAVAAVAAETGCPAAVISASHNPFPDNGVKLLAAGGLKLADASEAQVEAEMARLSSASPVGATAADSGPAASKPVSGDGIGRLSSDPGYARWYCKQVVAALDGRRLGGVKVVIDAANGAASSTAATILEAAGADLVDVLSAGPDGTNINDGCGSTDPSSLSEAVLSHGAEVGLAFDGDADRVIAVDDRGQIVDGDRLLALFAFDMKRRRALEGDTVVVTVMTNLGFHRAMAESGISVHETPVGDRYVLEALDSNGWSLGGEQSGHIIFRRLATTGDGVLSGMMLLDLLARSDHSLSDLAGSAMIRLPQVLRNVAVSDRDGLAAATDVWRTVRDVEAEMAGTGRVLLRPSGTEKVIRVMAEAETEQMAAQAVDRICIALGHALG